MIRVALIIAVALIGRAAVSAQTPVSVRANGVTLHYVEAGSGEPLILLHGGQGDYRAWQPQIDALSSRFRVISYSRRYHYPNANAIAGTNHSPRIEAADLAALVVALKLGPVHLAGTSYGALTALTFALEHPAQVRSLILAEPPLLKWANDIPEAAPLYHAFMTEVHGAAGQAFAAGRDTDAMRILIDEFDGKGAFDTLSEDRRRVVMQNAGFFKAVTASTDPFPRIAPEAVAALRVPSLVVRGANTDAMHRLVTERVAALLPNAKLVVIPDAGHGSPRQNPTAFTKAAAEFLAALPSR